MNLEELTYLGAQGGGAVTGVVMGVQAGSLGAAVGGLVVGAFVGWVLCFFPFLVARGFDEKKKEKLARVVWALGFSSPLLAPLVMWWLW